jgi:hypothetical protein
VSLESVGEGKFALKFEPTNSIEGDYRLVTGKQKWFTEAIPEIKCLMQGRMVVRPLSHVGTPFMASGFIIFLQEPESKT